MNVIQKLARPAIVALSPYKPAACKARTIRLNANESAYRPDGDSSQRGLNRYPAERPEGLTNRLATHYSVAPEQILVCRGSDEAIDLLIRTFCEAGTDSIVTCSPTFSMYEVYARIQGADVVDFPLLTGENFQPDVEHMIANWKDNYKMLFLTSPNNPTSNAIDPEHIRTLIRRLENRAIVVLDAAYAEFDNASPPVSELLRWPHVVILRTLSKAGALAGARVGSALGHPELIALLDKVMAPYSIPTPVVEAAMTVFSEGETVARKSRLAEVATEKERILARLRRSPLIRKIFPSQANFLFVQFADAAAILKATAMDNILIRDFSMLPNIRNCLRITIGSPMENNAFLDSLEKLENNS